jgi:hypothetical protein
MYANDGTTLYAAPTRRTEAGSPPSVTNTNKRSQEYRGQEQEREREREREREQKQVNSIPSHTLVQEIKRTGSEYRGSSCCSWPRRDARAKAKAYRRHDRVKGYNNDHGHVYNTVATGHFHSILWPSHTDKQNTLTNRTNTRRHNIHILTDGVIRDEATVGGERERGGRARGLKTTR